MKKLLSLLLCVGLLVSMTCTTFAAEDTSDVRVAINGTTVVFSASAPQIQNGVPSLPLVPVLQRLGFAARDITWTDATKTITAKNDAADLSLTIGKKDLRVTQAGTSRTISLSAAPYLSGGCTYVPLDLFSAALGQDVQWDSGTGTVKINDPYDLLITRDKWLCRLTSEIEPVAAAPSGSIIKFETGDAWHGILTGAETPYEKVKDIWPHTTAEYNPVTGPVYIEGAKVGDVLRIEIQKIELADVGHMYEGASFLTFYSVAPQDVCTAIPLRDGKAYYNDIVLDQTPMVGCIAVAPPAEMGVVNTLDPGTFGGNMDCTRMVEGAVLYLPVYVEGGLVTTGDLHAAMADGESSGMGIEIPGAVTLKVDVIKDLKLPVAYPLAVEGGDLIVMGHGATLDEAVHDALFDTHAFLTKVAGFTPTEAADLISLVGDVQINQVVDTLMGARVSFPLRVLEQKGYTLDF